LPRTRSDWWYIWLVSYIPPVACVCVCICVCKAGSYITLLQIVPAGNRREWLLIHSRHCVSESHLPFSGNYRNKLTVKSRAAIDCVFFLFPFCRCCVPPFVYVSFWVCYWLKNGVVIERNVLVFCLLPPSFFLIARHQLCVSVVRWPAWGIFLFQHGRLLLFQGQRGQGKKSSFIHLPRFTCLSLLRVLCRVYVLLLNVRASLLLVARTLKIDR
jgi:hypothetical protein